jgi:hypothetical protein
MLEAGVDLLTISKLLGHSSFVTTMVYLHVRRQHFDRSPSPIDWLPLRQSPQWAERPERRVAPGTDTPPPTPLVPENVVPEDDRQGSQVRPQRRTSGRPTPKHRRGRK